MWILKFVERWARKTSTRLGRAGVAVVKSLDDFLSSFLAAARLVVAKRP